MPKPVRRRTVMLLRPNISSKKKYSDNISTSKANKKGQMNRFLLIANDGCESVFTRLNKDRTKCLYIGHGSQRCNSLGCKRNTKQLLNYSF
jgi:hypothetical protein